MTDSSLCMNLVSIHWKLANVSAEAHKALKTAARVSPESKNPAKTL